MNAVGIDVSKGKSLKQPTVSDHEKRAQKSQPP